MIPGNWTQDLWKNSDLNLGGISPAPNYFLREKHFLPMCPESRGSSSVFVFGCVKVLHHFNAVPPSDHERSTGRPSWNRQNRNHQRPWPCPRHDGLCIQLFRANGLQGELLKHKMCSNSISPIWKEPCTFSEMVAAARSSHFWNFQVLLYFHPHGSIDL